VRLRLCTFAVVAAAAALPAAPAAGSARVVVARLDGEIHPAAADFVKRAIAKANDEHAALLILEISTPGGLMTSMRDITTSVVNSKVPVATYVYPPGARAASAGFFILLSGDVAAMAPGTNTGAAHPVGGQGEDISKTLNKKVEQDALAQIRTLCAAHGRDAAAAEKAVLESVSYTEKEALEKHLIEIVARDRTDLVRQLDGRTVKLTGGGEIRLSLRDPRYEMLEMSAIERALGIVSEPNFAYILFLIGIVGIYFELSHPGAVLPGVAGAVSLVLALYAFSVLPINFAGVGLILLGLLFIIAEIKFPVHGMLALSGAAALVAGSLLLFSGNSAGYSIDPWLVVPAAAAAGLTLAALSIRAVRIRSRPATTGAEGLIGEIGRALSDLAPEVKVLVHGEYWNARALKPAAAGSAVRVIAKNGFTLLVERVDPGRGEVA
jgi:membrane-bound serine protease (ClpP class)